MRRTAERRFVRHVCFGSPFLPFLWEMQSIHSLPEAWSCWERQYPPPVLHFACIMPIPSLHLQKKCTCLMQRSKRFGHAVVVSKICYNAVIVLSVVLCDCCKPMNTCRDWAFSIRGLEVWLPAFQLPRFAKYDALPKGDLLDMLVSGIHSRHSLGKCQASTPCQKLEVSGTGSTLYQLWIMFVLSLQKIPSLCRRFQICVSCREA